MKITKYAAAILLFTGLSGSTFADPTYMAGITYNFGGNIGFTFKILSDDAKSKVVGVVGGTYYPFSKKQFGFDAGAGYTFDNAAATVSWDFIQQSIQVGVGYADTDDHKKKRAVSPPAPPGA